jgi:glycosyltransferase involved in cell wall biosynthesis
MKKKLLYFHNGKSSFVEKDISILSECFDLKEFEFKTKLKILVPFEFIRQILFLLRHLTTKKSIVQFAGYHSFFPVILKKILGTKVLIILGGTDCVNFPSIKYGSFYKNPLRFFTSYSLHHASLLSPVDESLIQYEYIYQNADFNGQGFLYHYPKIKTSYKVIYNGYNSSKWKMEKKNKNTFVTIGANLNSRFAFKLKGIDLFIELAKNIPDGTFYIVGGKSLKQSIPSNMILLDNIPNHQLPDFLSDKQFYVQLSMSEGFPNALCEAMLSGCIPIVSSVGGMTMIVENCGIILEKKSIHELTMSVKKLMKDEKETDILSKQSRKRISENFTIENRAEKLIKLIQNL